MEKKRSGQPVPIVGQDPLCDWCRSEGRDVIAAANFSFPWGVRVGICQTHLAELIAVLVSVRDQFAALVEAKRREIEASAKPN